MSNAKVLNEAKLWPKMCGIPGKQEYRILCHLAADPEARVFLEEGNSYYAAVTNGNGVPGWVTHGKVDGLRSGCHHDRRAWVERDHTPPTRRSGQRALRSYRIAPAGFEAIAQHDARLAFEERQLVLAQRLLKLARKRANALKPK